LPGQRVVRIAAVDEVVGVGSPATSTPALANMAATSAEIWFLCIFCSVMWLMVYGLLTFIHTVESDFSLLGRRTGLCFTLYQNISNAKFRLWTSSSRPILAIQPAAIDNPNGTHRAARLTPYFLFHPSRPDRLLYATHCYQGNSFCTANADAKIAAPNMYRGTHR
jgi:hypothetical protein